MFAYLRERHGNTVSVEAEPSAEALLQALSKAGVRTDSCRLAVNCAFVKPEWQLSPGDEIALIPPVSGG